MTHIKLPILTTYKKRLADIITPVSIYLQIRDRFANPILLESSDYHGQENSYSYICFNPLATFSFSAGKVKETLPFGHSVSYEVSSDQKLMESLRAFGNKFDTSQDTFKFSSNGLFGYIQYDSVAYFEDIKLQNTQPSEVPMMQYSVYQNIIVVDHYKNELHLLEHRIAGAENPELMDEIERILSNKNIPSYSFKRVGEESSNYTDEEFLKILNQGREHCFKGDVFQIVLSRRFSTAFKGDEFNVYRALRSVNPSPYLFYFDYGSFKVFGSSPEAQIVVKDKKATIYPIAGTFRRTGNDLEDAALARKLYDDPKENSEHVMLVDLARNDLSRSSEKVSVDVFKEIQYYSHVIHLVSKVTGELPENANPLQLVADTFPAGTLSGAPKYRAMQLIDELENISREFYGGAIGYLGFNGDFNHAILIRSFVSENNQLRFQAGAGVVAKSTIPSELQEVANKLEALRVALRAAEGI
ncbi:anthranilate synthase component I family protein [Algoriphagus persicinus]|uniref:anthranilate synthase component I family protein n=1 Tax=Algoriphagus persicinus TaxID=3108754 RepID=UPI002B3A3C91|nr:MULTISPECIES: anthranilate synthase component I family protein [unclassified Algoriphagus]MEB2782268.1 anthranilate synthase component I family protein [Algoriphagus sp. C2-6-M1]MEB2783838.1 anthranilate synthase component I family protein [Algoriphagus sp. E1-3-M2]